jgi:hypothetical protein
MKTKIKSIKTLLKDSEDCPIPLEVIPNKMGINLCSVSSVSWIRQDDGQLISLTITFTPEKEEVNQNG